jgi:hypothetical protein
LHGKRCGEKSREGTSSPGDRASRSRLTGRHGFWEKNKPENPQDGVQENSMIRLELSDDEAAVLREALEFYMSDLRMEVADTDRLDFRNRLKQEETVIKKILGMLA